MIKLIDVIQEGKQVGLLYHFTTYRGLIGIIKQDFTLAKSLDFDNPYVSFTRNPRLYSDIPDEVRLSIDGTALSNKYKIEPHADVKAGYGRNGVDESEERISLKRYPRGVNIGPYWFEIAVKEAFAANRPDDEDDIGYRSPSSLQEYLALIKLLKQEGIPHKLVKQHK